MIVRFFLAIFTFILFLDVVERSQIDRCLLVFINKWALLFGKYLRLVFAIDNDELMVTAIDEHNTLAIMCLLTLIKWTRDRFLLWARKKSFLMGFKVPGKFSNSANVANEQYNQLQTLSLLIANHDLFRWCNARDRTAAVESSIPQITFPYPLRKEHVIYSVEYIPPKINAKFASNKKKECNSVTKNNIINNHQTEMLLYPMCVLRGVCCTISKYGIGNNTNRQT